MPLTHEQIEQRIADIREHCELSSQYYGRLLNWTDGFVWHYGIGLSATHIFDTGGGLCAFRFAFEPKFVVGVDDALFSPEQTIERLIHALRVFGNWDYGLFGWNCEHLARLIATDNPISYEVLKAPWPIPALNHNGLHPTAKDIFLKQLGAPELSVRHT